MDPVILTLHRHLTAIRARVWARAGQALSGLGARLHRLFGPLAQWVEQKTVRSFGRRFEPYTAHFSARPRPVRHGRRRSRGVPARRRARPG